MARNNNIDSLDAGAPRRRWARTAAVAATATLFIGAAPVAANAATLADYFDFSSEMSSAVSSVLGGGQNTKPETKPDEKPDPTTELSAELATVQKLQEEERMARDLYMALGEKWGARQFLNIQNSEQMHMNQLAALLDREGITHAGSGKEAGTYAYDDLQQLYDNWLERGLQSREEAFKVGIELEKQDIADLEAAKNNVQSKELKSIYGNLIEASQRHLQAFTRGLNGGGGMGPGHGGEMGAPQQR